METRGRQAAATRQRILDAARGLFDDRSSGFTLQNVAAAADVSVQTVLRAFASKEALIVAAIGTFRDRADTFEVPRSPAEAVSQLFDDYEQIGDRVIRMLAEEHQVAGFADVARQGRERHRAWVEAAFAPELAGRTTRERRHTLVALAAATDVYIWKLLRRDLGLGRAESQSAVTRLVRGALGNHHKGD